MDAGAGRSNPTNEQAECLLAASYGCGRDYFTPHCQNCRAMNEQLLCYCKMFPKYEPPGFIPQPESE